MHPDVHILWSVLQDVLVRLKVGVQNVFGIDAAGFHAAEDRLGAEVGKQWIVELDVSLSMRIQTGRDATISHTVALGYRPKLERRLTTTKRVELLNFLPVRNRDIGEIFLYEM